MVLVRHQKDLLQLQPRLDIPTAQLEASRLGEYDSCRRDPRPGTAISHSVGYQEVAI